jgi:RNA-directed DNA polymerase
MSTRRNSTTDQRQKNQYGLAFPEERRGAAPRAFEGGTESGLAKRTAESPTSEQWMEEVCERENCKQALRRVKANKGRPGIAGRTVEELSGHLKEHWPAIREQLLKGTYTPQPVKRVEIPKPDGGVRKLGIPTVRDRCIQQAVMQALRRNGDGMFSEHSYGFRPKRSAHQAVEQTQQYQAEGYRWVVDLDLEKFFDRVHHDRLLAKIAERVSDRRLLKLIRAFLRAGVMENGLVSPAEEGTPQGGPLSPVLSNIVLHELDQELARRGHRFTRYADDCNIYVRSRRAGERVMSSVTRLLTTKLKLRVNSAKSAVARPWERKFLGFSFTNHKQPKRRLAPKAVARFKERVRELSRRTRGISLAQMVHELTEYLRGWMGYFGRCETPSVLAELAQ